MREQLWHLGGFYLFIFFFLFLFFSFFKFIFNYLFIFLGGGFRVRKLEDNTLDVEGRLDHRTLGKVWREAAESRPSVGTRELFGDNRGLLTYIYNCSLVVIFGMWFSGAQIQKRATSPCLLWLLGSHPRRAGLHWVFSSLVACFSPALGTHEKNVSSKENMCQQRCYCHISAFMYLLCFD